jgi:flagellar hook assembly protein FlgD
MKQIAAFLFSAIIFCVPAHAVKVYPNPWIPADMSGTQGSYSYDGQIKFDGLPVSGGTIMIYNVSGELVRKINWNSATLARWDGKNEKGEYVASGIYIWVLTAGGRETGKISVVR